VIANDSRVFGQKKHGSILKAPGLRAPASLALEINLVAAKDD